jgi:hypothetical protein
MPTLKKKNEQLRPRGRKEMRSYAQLEEKK